MSDHQSSGVSKAGRPSQVIREPPELGVMWSIICPDLAMIFFEKGADLKNKLSNHFS